MFIALKDNQSMFDHFIFITGNKYSFFVPLLSPRKVHPHTSDLGRCALFFQVPLSIITFTPVFINLLEIYDRTDAM